MEKLYKKIGWKNKPNLSTPLGATNMGKIDEALDGLDNRTIELDEQRANHKRLIDDLYVNVNEHTSAIEGLTEKSNDIDALKIISAASGSPAYIDDASNINIENIVFYGESKQNGTPTPDNPQPIESKIVNSVDVRGANQLPNELKSRTESGLTIDSTPERIKVTGTTLRGVTVSVCETKIESKKGLFIKGATKLEGLSYIARIHNYSTGAMQYWGIGTNGGYIAPGWTIERVYIQQGNADVTVDAEIQPQIVVGNVDLPFEPYQSQTVNLSAPIELNRIGGVRDTIEIYSDGTGKYIQRIGKVVANKNTRFNTLELSTLQRVSFTITNMLNLSGRNADVLSSHFVASIEGTIYSMFHAGTEIYLYVGVNNATDFNSFIADKEITFYYPIAEPIETALPQADIDAIKALHTYKPNTVVMNDADAEMDVKYVSDVKIYIDRKFEALASAIVNQ